MLLRAVAWARPAAIPFAIALPGRCTFVPPSFDASNGASLAPAPAAADPERSAVHPKSEAAPSRVTSPPPRPRREAPVAAITLPDEVVVRAVGVGQPAFLRCWARAQRIDLTQITPTQIATKVRLHLEVDATGRVTSVESDSESPTLSRCLAVVARALPFPAPGQPAVIDLPLIFR